MPIASYSMRTMHAATVVVALVLALAASAPAAHAVPDAPSDADYPDRPGIQSLEDDSPERLIVHLGGTAAGGGVVAPQRAALDTAAERLGLERHGGVPALGAVVYGVPAGKSIEEAADGLRSQPGVDTIERDAPVVAAEVTPNDGLWEFQWGPRRIESPAAWRTTTGGGEVTIAILDTGVAPDHPDLRGKVDSASGANFTAEGSTTDTGDRNGHGTSSAGVAAAATNNVEGIAGSCWGCVIMPVKVIDKDGRGSVSDVAAGVVHAVDAGADVLNLSLGSLSDLELLRGAVDYATSRDVVLVASAGNFGNADGSEGEGRVYPAAYRDVLGVAASDEHDDRYAFSSFGDWVTVAAPGCNVATDLPTSDLGYRWFCGTSSSAPLVAGVVGLALTHDPSASPGRVSAAIAESSVALDYVDAGRVDAAAALAALPDVDEPGADDEPRPPPDDDADGDVEADPGLTMRRISGADRYETAVRLSLDAYEPGVARVYLSTGTAFADALAGGAVAGAERAPILLTRPGSLPEDTAGELERLAPAEVVVLGGTVAVSDEVEAAAGQAAGAPTRRIAGSDRYDTAGRLAQDSFDAPTPVSYIATGVGFADALAGVPAAVADGGPMLLTAPQSLPAATRAALEELRPERIVVLGGTSAVSAEVATDLEAFTDGSVERIAGATRYETAALVSAQTVAAGAGEAYLATGVDFPDALAAGPLAGRAQGPVLLVTLDTLPPATRDELRRIQPATNITLGGTAVISQETEAAAGEASAAEN